MLGGPTQVPLLWNIVQCFIGVIVCYRCWISNSRSAITVIYIYIYIYIYKFLSSTAKSERSSNPVTTLKIVMVCPASNVYDVLRSKKMKDARNPPEIRKTKQEKIQQHVYVNAVWSKRLNRETIGCILVLQLQLPIQWKLTHQQQKIMQLKMFWSLLRTHQDGDRNLEKFQMRVRVEFWLA